MVVALIVGGITMMSRPASRSGEPSGISPPPSFTVAAALFAENAPIVPPEVPAPEQFALAEQVPVRRGQADTFDVEHHRSK